MTVPSLPVPRVTYISEFFPRSTLTCSSFDTLNVELACKKTPFFLKVYIALVDMEKNGVLPVSFLGVCVLNVKNKSKSKAVNFEINFDISKTLRFIREKYCSCS